MGSQILRQPNGLFALFSSNSDRIIVTDATREEILDHFVGLAVQDTIRGVSQVLDHVESGHPDQAYYQFALTWDQAVTRDREHGGDVWQNAGEHRDISPADTGSAGAPRP